MPNFFFLDKAPVDAVKLTKTMKVMTQMPFNPVPKTIYTDAVIAGAAKEVEGKTEMDSVIAFLQSLGNHVKFEEGVNYRD
jgi:cytochrome c oxidase cbb3-type subunit 2